MPVSPDDADRLLQQVIFMYQIWARQPMTSNEFAQAVNGLFQIAEEIDKAAMVEAFKSGQGLT